MRRLWNLLIHGMWSDCRHEHRQYGKHYFPYCTKCGAMFSDYIQPGEKKK